MNATMFFTRALRAALGIAVCAIALSACVDGGYYDDGYGGYSDGAYAGGYGSYPPPPPYSYDPYYDGGYYGPGYGPGAIYGGIIYFRDYDGRYYRSDDGRHWRDGRGRDRDGGDRYRRGNDGRYVRDSGNSAPSTGSNDDATTVRRLLHDPNQRRADRAARQQGQGPGIVAPQQNGDGDFRERRRGNPRTQGDVPSQHTAPPRDDGDSDDDDDKRRRRRGG